MKKIYPTSYEEYEILANQTQCNIQASGRYIMQKEAEKKIAPDILKKLDIKTSDNLLEIGCGTGNLLIPLSSYVNKAIGIDNQVSINRMLTRVDTVNLTGVAGDFLKININDLGKFNKILIYSVIHYIKDLNTLYTFIDKALKMLENNGMLLIGDIPNASLKNSFLTSDKGKKFILEWDKKMENNKSIFFEFAKNEFILDDKSIFNMMRHIKKQGYKAYLLPQPSDLPFGYTREDIIISSF